MEKIVEKYLQEQLEFALSKEGCNEELVHKNMELCRRFPFLIPWNRWTGKFLENYDLSWTELDDMPNGWKEKFGVQMCEEIREELIRCNFLYEYKVAQIKEKWGGLRWYDNGIPQDCNVWDIVSKYEDVSENTCIKCGEQEGVKLTKSGWIIPLCPNCKKTDV